MVLMVLTNLKTILRYMSLDFGSPNNSNLVLKITYYIPTLLDKDKIL